MEPTVDYCWHLETVNPVQQCVVTATATGWRLEFAIPVHFKGPLSKNWKESVCLKLNENAGASFEVNQVTRVRYVLRSCFHAILVGDHIVIKTGPTCPDAGLTCYYIYRDVLRILWFSLEIITAVWKKWHQMWHNTTRFSINIVCSIISDHWIMIKVMQWLFNSIKQRTEKVCIIFSWFKNLLKFCIILNFSISCMDWVRPFFFLCNCHLVTKKAPVLKCTLRYAGLSSH